MYWRTPIRNLTVPGASKTRDTGGGGSQCHAQADKEQDKRHLPIPHHPRLNHSVPGKFAAHADQSGTPVSRSVYLGRETALLGIRWFRTARRSSAVVDDFPAPRRQ